MKTSTIVGAAVALLVAGGAWYWLENGVVSPPSLGADYQNATYRIEGQSVKLVDGRAEAAAAPGAAAKVVTAVFGPAAVGDLNGDGHADAAVLLSQDSGGSGTFFYLGAVLNPLDSRSVENTYLLGDRIAPQNIEIRDGLIIANYAVRREGEPMTTQPSIGMSAYLRLNGTMLEVDEAAAKSNLIRLTSPLPNAEVTSPLAISGEARGNWFFEASFPVSLVDWDGKILAQGIATAQGEWMTTEFVPFTATLTFDTADISGQYSNRGALILQKDNPSGLPEHDDALEVPLLLK